MPPTRPPPPPHLRSTAATAVEETVTVIVDATVAAAIDALVERLSAAPTVAALGIRVTRQAAARAALLRGVEEMMAPQATVAVAPVAAPAASPNLLDRGEPLLSSAAAASVEMPPPPNWSPAPSPIGGPEAELHAWYTARGWKRFVAATKRGPAVLYWSPQPLYRPLCPDSFDAGMVTANVEGYGAVHLVPDGWAAQRGADGAELREGMPQLRASMGDGADGAMPGKASVLR